MPTTKPGNRSTPRPRRRSILSSKRTSVLSQISPLAQWPPHSGQATGTAFTFLCLYSQLLTVGRILSLVAVHRLRFPLPHYSSDLSALCFPTGKVRTAALAPRHLGRRQEPLSLSHALMCWLMTDSTLRHETTQNISLSFFEDTMTRSGCSSGHPFLFFLGPWVQNGFSSQNRAFPRPSCHHRRQLFGYLLNGEWKPPYQAHCGFPGFDQGLRSPY
jgi:hypothetical protein